MNLWPNSINSWTWTPVKSQLWSVQDLRVQWDELRLIFLFYAVGGVSSLWSTVRYKFSNIMNAVKTVRNHWKKTVALIAVSAFGIRYADKKYKYAEIFVTALDYLISLIERPVLPHWWKALHNCYLLTLDQFQSADSVSVSNWMQSLSSCYLRNR